MGYIYKVTNTVNGKMYIGQTRRTIPIRWGAHKTQSKKLLKYRCLLYSAMRKYGIDSFVVEEVEQCDDELLNEREIFWIKEYDTVKNGYNISKGGLGYHHDASPVVQFDMSGNYVKLFDSANDAAISMNCLPQSIYNACRGYFASYGGHQWRFLKDAESCGMSLPKRKVQPGKRAVHQYTLDGDYITSYDSISSAMSQFHSKGTGGIRRVCEGDIRWSHGYRWSYEKVEKLPPMREDKSNRPVAKMDDNLNILKVYPTIASAAKEHGVTPHAIESVCNGIHAKCVKFKWKFLPTTED